MERVLDTTPTMSVTTIALHVFTSDTSPNHVSLTIAYHPGLFVLDGVWCILALIYNPGYRAFFLKPKGAPRLATRGPHALVRHPRYAGEAAWSVGLAAFTGAWLPLLGLLGWPALREQAQREEEWLLSAVRETRPGREDEAPS